MTPRKKQKMKKIIQIAGWALLLVPIAWAVEKTTFDPTMKLRILVRDDEGNSAPGAFAVARFPLLGANHEQKKPDAEGRVEFIIPDWSGPHIDFFINNGESMYAPPVGYYADHGGAYLMNNKPDLLLHRWEPWGPEVKITLKKIKNPVPLQIIEGENSHYLFPVEIGQEAGFDFLAHDWTAPYGKGKKCDAYIRVESLNNEVPETEEARWGMNNLKVIVRFPIPTEGMIKFPHSLGLPVVGMHKNLGSALWHNHQSPQIGYSPLVEFQGMTWKQMEEGIPCGRKSPQIYGFSFGEDPEAFTRALMFKRWHEGAYMKIRSTESRRVGEEGLYAVFSYGITANWQMDSIKNPPEAWRPIIHMKYKLNPTPGDRSLEWNGVDAYTGKLIQKNWQEDQRP